MGCEVKEVKRRVENRWKGGEKGGEGRCKSRVWEAGRQGKCVCKYGGVGKKERAVFVALEYEKQVDKGSVCVCGGEMGEMGDGTWGGGWKGT